jgi:hypothetical protein
MAADPAGGLPPAEAISDKQIRRARRGRWVDAHLTWLPQIAFVVAAVSGFAGAPLVDGHHVSSRLDTFFILVFTAAVTLGIALLVYQRGGGNARALRFLSAFTAAYVVVGVLAPLGGVLPLRSSAYRYLFALSLGGVVGILATLALFGVTNLRGQRADAVEETRDRLAGMQTEAERKCAARL